MKKPAARLGDMHICPKDDDVRRKPQVSGNTVKPLTGTRPPDDKPITIKNYVAISSAGNSVFCFDYSASETNPPIVFIVGDYEASDPRSVIPIAGSFTELLDMLEN